MEKVTINDIEPYVLSEDSARRELSDPLGATHIAINYYRLRPGEGFPGGLHAHMDQEEVFVIIEGEATFETLEGEVTVGEWEAIRFTPGEFQSGMNESDRDLTAFAIGAPRNTEDIRIPVECPECGHDNLRLDISESGLTFVCPDCATNYIPRNCPECGHADLRITLGEKTHIIVVCQGCGTEFENPPLQH